jgi:hypothetical protein
MGGFISQEVNPETDTLPFLGNRSTHCQNGTGLPYSPPGYGHRHQGEAKRMRLSHACPRAPDRQGPSKQEAKIRGKEGDPATEKSGKGQPHGLGRISRL